MDFIKLYNQPKKPSKTKEFLYLLAEAAVAIFGFVVMIFCTIVVFL